jgi:FkbM family methyltransferase
MRFEWVDIGTSDFDLGYGSVGLRKGHLLVEPVNYYLERIPNENGVVKVNAGISDRDGESDVYYISDSVIVNKGLPFWVRGCNSIGSPHKTLKHLFHNEDVWTVERVRIMKFSTLVNELGITEIGSLKIDTEGHDHIVLQGVAESMDAGLKVDRIMCEYVPSFGNTEDIDRVCLRLGKFFKAQELKGEDIYLTI